MNRFISRVTNYVLASLLLFPILSKADIDAKKQLRDWQIKVDQFLARGSIVGIKSYVQKKLITDKVVKLHSEFGAIEVPDLEGTNIAVLYNPYYYAWLEQKVGRDNWFLTKIAIRDDELYQQEFEAREGALVVPVVLTGIHFTTAIEENLTVQDLGYRECDGVNCQVFILESDSWKGRIWFWEGDAIPKRIDVLRSSKGNFTRTVLFRDWVETNLGPFPARVLVYRDPVALEQ